MGWFSRQFHKATAAVAKVKNFAKPIVTKVKHGWSKAGQAGTFIHQKVMPKLKTGLTIASALPVVGTYAAVGLEGVTAADEALGTALEAKAKIDKTAGRLDQYSKRIGKYSKKYEQQIKKGDIGGLIKTTGSAVKEGRKAYKTEKANYQDMRDHFN